MFWLAAIQRSINIKIIIGYSAKQTLRRTSWSGSPQLREHWEKTTFELSGFKLRLSTKVVSWTWALETWTSIRCRYQSLLVQQDPSCAIQLWMQDMT